MVNNARTPMAINRGQVPGVPGALKESLADAWEAFAHAVSEARLPLPRDPDFAASLLRVWACSDFACDVCVQHPELLYDLLDRGDLLSDYATGEYGRKLELALRGVDDEAGLGDVLRDFRTREMLRIAWRDLAGWVCLDEVLVDLTRLADACIAGALKPLGRWAAAEYGSGKRQPKSSLVVLGMGKLGAHELNFSSDIDLIFAYPGSEKGWPSSNISIEEFHLRIGQQLIRALDSVTDRGFVYRVDMRLRPYGDSGPLVASFDAMADYYQLQGREWERYAMIKARPVAGPKTASRELMQLLQPFVYRRYLDFDAFESLRNLKLQIVREVERKGMQDNIKLGPGGIREIEFIAQAFQLVRGGRQPLLQERNVLVVLQALAVLGYLPAHVTLQLTEAYVFLRRVENRLQAVADQQVHELPEDDTGRMRLAYAMGFPDWEAFAGVLAGHRRLVQEHFEQVFATPQEKGAAKRGEDVPDLEAVWAGRLEAEEAIAELGRAGYLDADELVSWLDGFRKGPVTRFLGERGSQQLDRLMPMLLGSAATAARPSETLKRVGDVLEAISGRTAYLTLLVEHPMALSQLVQLCSASTWVAAELAHYPILLDELLDPRTLYTPLDKAGLQGVLEARLAGIPPDDLEQRMDRLRQFRHAAVLHVAASDIVSDLPVPAVGDHLTDVAEVVLESVLAQAREQLAARYGRPSYEVKGKRREAQFAIIAYGKLGGRELGYSSDLDLVFLHDSQGRKQRTTGPKVLDNSEFFTRLGQRIIHLLNTFTAAGILYEVDTRLRPNGASGLLVSSLEAFADYQRRSAWTWESQALVRARVVAGDHDLARQFERVRCGVLARPRDAGKLCHEVVEMRERMRNELDTSRGEEINLKHARGGIVDIEFMVQFGVLLWSGEYPDLLKATDTRHLLGVFAETGLLSLDDAEALRAAYYALRRRINHLALQEEPPLVSLDELAGERAAVAGIWDKLMAAGQGG
jgi:glutamate-ammonia-ligase adenylyltransferase